MIKNYNPDVLTCLANLSNDEVFTPPQLANQILDMLPTDLWIDRNATFLDPVCKSGIFLREIAKRLLVGLEAEIPDRQERINHIFSKQLFGIAITELTSLMSRRSIYCSKFANGKYSVCEELNNEQGNIIYGQIEHTWQNGNCIYCGASQDIHDRADDLETHAYQFIHTDNLGEIFNMKFDVIIGNPPYQLSDGGFGTSASPLYHRFVEQAQKLNPRYLAMIIPSRWFAGGKGLDKFREEILNDKRLCKIIDFFDSTECFPGVDISGGVCYFLWKKDSKGDCEVTSVRKEHKSIMTRPLLEKNCNIFIRFNEAVPIFRKIQAFNEDSISGKISSRKPFGFSTIVKSSDKPFENSLKIYSYPKNGYIERNRILQNQQWVDQYKVYTAKSYGERGAFPYRVLGKPFLGEPDSCCSETYLVIGPYSSKNMATNVISYIQTRFFRFLVLLIKNTQDATKKVYSFVPVQDFNEPWTDEKLYKKYGLNEEEIAFIESMIRPMELDNE